jgi:type I restriction enzyme S subunit
MKMSNLNDSLFFIRGITFKPEDKVEVKSENSAVCMRTKNIQKKLDESDLISVPISFVKRKELFLQKGDILISSANSWELVGKCVQVGELNYPATAGGFISVLRAKENVDSTYLYYLLSSPNCQNNIRHLGRQTTNISNLDRVRFLQMQIQLPSLAIQKQIAEVLKKADTLCKQAHQVESELKQLARSLFLDMFGDPVTNPKKFITVKVKDITKFMSGGTPSKQNMEYWEGSFPWVSPKDMKVNYISDSIDHISESVFNETSLKKVPVNSILVVVRGMILVHTFPLAITTKEVSINQDIKALIINGNILPEFILWQLKTMDTHLLGKISSAAHGTKRLEMSELENTVLILPKLDQQQKYLDAVTIIKQLSSDNKKAILEHRDLFNTLLQKAFKGELDFS